MGYTDELEQIRHDNDGVLRPYDVVTFAEDEGSELHSRFEWDDAKAGPAHRLWQARQLIAVVVRTHPATKGQVRVYVSLTDDRQVDGGGYRTTEDVMASVAMREALLGQAERDMDRFREKYEQLQELATVIAAMKKAKRKPRRKGSRR